MSAPTPQQMAQWPPPNYINPETRVSAQLSIIITGTVIMLVFVAGRVVSRLKMKGSFELDDWIILVAAAVCLCTSILGCATTAYGGGYHLWDVKPEWIIPFSKSAYAGMILFNICVTLPKLALCLTYLRIFTSRTNKILCYTVLTFLLTWIPAVTLVYIFQCNPVKAYWNFLVRSQKCLNLSNFHVAVAAINSVTDIIIYLWPARSIWQIQLPRKLRLKLTFVFTFGAVICIAGICRMWIIHKTLSSYEYCWDGSIIWITASVEYNIGIMFACFHGVKPILALIWPNTFGTALTKSGTKGSGYSASTAKQASNGSSSASKSFALQSVESQAKSPRLTHFDDPSETSLVSPNEKAFSFGMTKPLDEERWERRDWAPVSEVAGRVETQISRGNSRERPKDRIKCKQQITVQSLPSVRRK